MHIGKILIPLSGRYDPEDPEDLDVPALQTGLSAARQFTAHAEILCVTGERSDPDVGRGAWMLGQGVRELIDMMEKEGDARRRRARAAYDLVVAAFDPPPERRTGPGPGFSARFVEEIGEIGEIVGAHGRLSDLIVIASSKARWEMPFRPIVEASLRRTASPVLVSPPQAHASFATKIAVAWNDSVEAARAVSASLGLLKSARSVHIICCKESDSIAPSPHGLIEHLAWHGIAAKPVELAKPPRQAGPAIVGAAKAAGCDLVILGGYIHNRAHSLLYGSLTEYVLGNPKLPALIVP